ncbi:hypothetical protein G5B37_06570 [Rasiella rasia]|uniref:Uncharacterized protein n=1 Tax=Rasiella rasia TaxID=2744027 RepID=A0A6G6GKW8_9FLAO|nr:hypothetical protein [Rasiella rasia]QIE59236.1 hypothetical protein G5B37_06570 [Rasiella rasia]
MKNFKYITLAFIAVVGLTSLTSCEDEDKARFPELGNGGFVKFVEAPEFNAGADPTSANFSAMTEDPNGNLASYELSVRGSFTGASTDTIPFRSTTSFPFDVSFSGADMAGLFGVDVSTFEEGDSFEFFGTATTVDGVVYSFEQTACDCPTDPEDESAPGTWNGANTDGVLMTAAGLLQAFNYEVEFSDPPIEE